MSRTDARLHFGLTEAGKVILEGISFVALAALIFPAFGVLSILVWVVLAALAAGFILRPRIRLSPAQGDGPDQVMAGQTVRLTYALKNVGRFTAYNLCVKFAALPEGIEQIEGEQVVSRLVSGGSAQVTIAIRPRRRGHYTFKQPVCHSSFPFNLFSFGCAAREEQTLLVLPSFSMLRMSTGGPTRQVTSGSTKLAGRMGYSPEYAGNRPFLRGDSPRKIDARAWARLSVPATKEYHDDFDNYTALVLDTAVPEALLRPKPREIIKELEAAVSLCASVAYSINNQSLTELLLAGPDLHQFTDRPRTVRLRMIHEILADVEPSQSSTWEQTEAILANRFFAISDVIFILLSWKSSYKPLIELAAESGCRCMVLVVGGHGLDEPAHWSRPCDVRILSAEEILAGTIESL